jgi:plasmid stabilization system protein ParE
MADYALSSAARDDLESITNYTIDTFGEAQASATTRRCTGRHNSWQIFRHADCHMSQGMASASKKIHVGIAHAVLPAHRSGRFERSNCVT